jgi:hypothetical protein
MTEKRTDFRPRYPPFPHARAAGPPTGRSFFWRQRADKAAVPPKALGIRGQGREWWPGLGVAIKRDARRAARVGNKFQDQPAGIIGQRLQENEKGGWCKPPFSELTPQNRNPSRGWVSATPGSQSLYCWQKGEQAGCQHSILLPDYQQPTENTGVKWSLGFEAQQNPCSKLQNPTEESRFTSILWETLSRTNLRDRKSPLV